MLWTTAPYSNVCSDDVGGDARDYRKFATRDECEVWVKERSCRPGYACFDGCNWRHCSWDGESIEMTYAACVSWLYNFEFSPGSQRLSNEPEWSWMEPGIARELKAPQRRLVISGFVEPGESESRAGADRLARARAELVRGKLLKHGIAAKRIVTQLGDADSLRATNYQGGLALVRISFDPTERVREDFEPNSHEYKLYCGTFPRK